MTRQAMMNRKSRHDFMRIQCENPTDRRSRRAKIAEARKLFDIALKASQKTK